MWYIWLCCIDNSNCKGLTLGRVYLGVSMTKDNEYYVIDDFKLANIYPRKLFSKIKTSETYEENLNYIISCYKFAKDNNYNNFKLMF